MRQKFSAIAVGLALSILQAGARAEGPQAYKAGPGPAAVATLEADWNDAARKVTVPVKIYYPKNLAELAAPAPLVIFSHGLGGSREGYQMWAEQWASYGYIVLLPTHVGSDSSILTDVTALRDAMSGENALHRAQDVSFVIDQMQKASDGTLTDKTLAVFKSRVDLKHVGMSGHSFGAQTTLMVSGETLPLKISLTDKRITAAIAMSPQPAAGANQKAAFGSIRIPMLHITGTQDDAPAILQTDVKAADRRVPFDNETYAETYLVTFEGAVHMTFAPTARGETLGQRLRARQAGSTNTPAQEEAIHTLVKECTTAFWDAYLKGDAKAKAWLQTDFSKVLGAAGKFETKNK